MRTQTRVRPCRARSLLGALLLGVAALASLAAGCQAGGAPGEASPDGPAPSGNALEAAAEGAPGPHERAIERAGMRVAARYLPTEALMRPHERRAEEERRALAADTALTREARRARLAALEGELGEARARYGAALYFRLTIGRTGGGDLVYERLGSGHGAYADWLRRLLFGLEGHAALVAGGEPIPPSLYHLERTFGMAPHRRLLLAFPAERGGRPLREGDGPVELRLGEFGLGTGALAFPFDPRTL